MGALILFHNQKSDSAGQARGISDIEHVELAAELPVQRTGESYVQAGRHHSILAHLIFNAKAGELESLNPSLCQIREKTQLSLFLEIRPVLDFRSGQYLYHSSSYGDPPGFNS